MVGWDALSNSGLCLVCELNWKIICFCKLYSFNKLFSIFLCDFAMYLYCLLESFCICICNKSRNDIYKVSVICNYSDTFLIAHQVSNAYKYVISEYLLKLTIAV